MNRGEEELDLVIGYGGAMAAIDMDEWANLRDHDSEYDFRMQHLMLGAELINRHSLGTPDPDHINLDDTELI
jgi:hypothetical protein